MIQSSKKPTSAEPKATERRRVDRKPFSCRLPVDSLKTLEGLADGLGLTKTEVVVMALRFLETQPEVAEIADAKRRLLERA